MRVFAYFLRVQKVGRPGGETPNPKGLPVPAGKRDAPSAVRSAALRAAGTKKKDTTCVVSFFLVEISGIEPLTS